MAFFHAPSTLKVAVVPPPDIDNGMYWWLQKAMNGTREASKQWGDQVTHVMVNIGGFHEIVVCPGTFYHAHLDVMIAVHGDDFIGSGTAENLNIVDALMKEHFEVKVLPRIGDPTYGGETASGKHLGRTISWNPDGFTWNADQKYQKMIVEELGLTNAKGSDLPCAKNVGGNVREADDLLSEEEASQFRHLTGMALYLSLDRPSIQFAVCDLSSGMSQPKVVHMLKLRKLGKYLLKYPEEIWLFKYQDVVKQLTVFTDSDWATDHLTRRSMSCSVELFGLHLIEVSCGRQSVVALSSAEAEFYAMTRGAASGLQTIQIYQGSGLSITLVLKCDSSAARGIASRNGSGKVKHLHIRELWLQSYVRSGSIKLEKVDTLFNLADIATKCLPLERLTSLMAQLPLKRVMMSAMLVQRARGQGEDEFETVVRWTTALMIAIVILLMIVSFFLGRWSCKLVPVRNQENEDEESEYHDHVPELVMNEGKVAEESALRKRAHTAMHQGGSSSDDSNFDVTAERVAPPALRQHQPVEGTEAGEGHTLNWPAKRVLGATQPGDPPASDKLRRDVLMKCSINTLRNLCDELNVSNRGSLQVVVNRLVDVWHAGTARQLRYMMFIMCRHSARPTYGIGLDVQKQYL